MDWETKDSGTREGFHTGSQRDSREGKGRFDLLPFRALRRLAGVYERGAAKYGDRNWELGQPQSRYLDSALRHLGQAALGETDEDHLAQAAFNVMAMIDQEERRDNLPQELFDLPHHLAEKEAKAKTLASQISKTQSGGISSPLISYPMNETPIERSRQMP